MTYKGLKNILGQFRDLLVPAGTVILFAGTTLPSRYILCDGRRVLKADYPKLWSAIGHTWALPTDTAAMKADYFRLPDLRECVAVGAGLQNSNPNGTGYYKNTTRVFEAPEANPNTGSGGTQTHDAYLLGTFKDDQFQGHEHDYYLFNHATGNDTSGGTYEYDYSLEDRHTTSEIINKSGYGNVRYGTTTHGKQVGLYYIIKY